MTGPSSSAFFDEDFRPEVFAATRADAPPARARAVNEATEADAKSARLVGARDVIGRGALMMSRAVRTDNQRLHASSRGEGKERRRDDDGGN